MAKVPGLKSDISFGSVDAPLPDWRKDSPDTDDPEKADEDDDNSALLKQLYGYDPSWHDKPKE